MNCNVLVRVEAHLRFSPFRGCVGRKLYQKSAPARHEFLRARCCCPCALDRGGRRPYSLSFGLTVHFPTVQRSCGSDGVEALPGFVSRKGPEVVDRYCGVNFGAGVSVSSERPNDRASEERNQSGTEVKPNPPSFNKGDATEKFRPKGRPQSTPFRSQNIPDQLRQSRACRSCADCRTHGSGKRQERAAYCALNGPNALNLN